MVSERREAIRSGDYGRLIELESCEVRREQLVELLMMLQTHRRDSERRAYREAKRARFK